MITVKQITKEETYPFRIEILRDGKAINYHFVGDTRKTTIHLGAYIDLECIGIVSLIRNSHKIFSNLLAYQLRGMAVAKSHQKQGIGELLIVESLKILNNNKCEVLWCNARVIAVEFYKKMNFSIKGKKFQIPGVGSHYLMYIDLST